METPCDLIQSVSRALRILEVVGAHPDGVAPKVIARRAGVKLATTYHLLRTLAYEGYLVRDDVGDYALGLHIADRFVDLRRALSAPKPIETVLQDVTERTGLSAYLARFVDGRVAITTVVEGPGSPHLEDLIPGFDDAAHATALGKALLSRLPPADRRRYLAEQGLPRFTEWTLTELAGLEHELADQGPVFVEEGQFRTAVSCAAALIDAGGHADAAGAHEGRWWAIAVVADAEAFAARRVHLASTLVGVADGFVAA